MMDWMGGILRTLVCSIQMLMRIVWLTCCHLGLVVGQTILNLPQLTRENLKQQSSDPFTRDNINYHGFINVLNQALRKCELN